MTDTSKTDAAQDLLPLTPAVFHILLALVDGPKHGYGISKEVRVATDGRTRLGPGTLYGTLARMAGAGLVEETRADERRRFYRVTALGRDVARAEARRLADLLRIARAKALVVPGEP